MKYSTKVKHILNKNCLSLIINALNCALKIGDELLIKMISEATLNYSIILGDEETKKYAEKIYRKYSEDIEIEEILATEKEFKGDYYLLPAIYTAFKLLDKDTKDIYGVVKLLLESANCLNNEKKFDTSKLKEEKITKDLLQIYYNIEEELFGKTVHHIPFEKMWTLILKMGKPPRIEDITTIDFIYETLEKLKRRNLSGSELAESLIMIIKTLYSSKEVKTLAETILKTENII